MLPWSNSLFFLTGSNISERDLTIEYVPGR